MPRSNPDSEENIRRIDSVGRKGGGGGTHGFQVHFSRGGVHYTALFSDALCGGKEKARKKSREFRETLRSSVPPTAAGASRSGPSRSNTGYMGVSITGGSASASGGKLMVEASVRIEKGKPMNKKFPVNEFSGLRGAILKAVSWRNERLTERKANELARERGEA